MDNIYYITFVLKNKLNCFIRYFYLLLLNLLLLDFMMPISETYNWNECLKLLKLNNNIWVLTNSIERIRFNSIFNNKVSSFTKLYNLFENILLNVFFYMY